MSARTKNRHSTIPEEVSARKREGSPVHKVAIMRVSHARATADGGLTRQAAGVLAWGKAMFNLGNYQLLPIFLVSIVVILAASEIGLQ